MTQEELKKILYYNPDDGYFRWKITFKQKKYGQIAGSIDKKGYRRIGLLNKQYSSARLAFFYMTGRWPNEIDHINRQRDDDRWINLREVTRSQNTMNKKYPTKYGLPRGVTRNGKRYQTSITDNGKKIYLGTYDTPEEASKVWQIEAKKLRGNLHD